MAALIRYEPLATRYPLLARDTVDRVVDRLFDNAFGPVRGRAAHPGLAANLYETANAYVIEVPLPGVAPEHVQITVQENVLSIRAPRQVAAPEGARVIWQGFQGASGRSSSPFPARSIATTWKQPWRRASSA